MLQIPYGNGFLSFILDIIGEALRLFLYILSGSLDSILRSLGLRIESLEHLVDSGDGVVGVIENGIGNGLVREAVLDIVKRRLYLILSLVSELVIVRL